MSDFNAKIATFINGCQNLIDDENLVIPQVLAHRVGKKYIKIVVKEGGEDRSAFCFVNKENGDVLKPASWSAPAKGARGNIFDAHNGLRTMSWTGPAYLR